MSEVMCKPASLIRLNKLLEARIKYEKVKASSNVLQKVVEELSKNGINKI